MLKESIELASWDTHRMERGGDAIFVTPGRWSGYSIDIHL
jgi:hypothetical protein